MNSAPKNTFPKSSRLLQRREFNRTVRTGRRYFSRHFVVYVLPNQAPSSRLGLTVSRKVGVAVVRNRVKRCVREVFRTHSHWFSLSCDVVVIAKSADGDSPREGSPPVVPKAMTFQRAQSELGPVVRRAMAHLHGVTFPAPPGAAPLAGAPEDAS